MRTSLVLGSSLFVLAGCPTTSEKTCDAGTCVTSSVATAGSGSSSGASSGVSAGASGGTQATGEATGGTQATATHGATTSTGSGAGTSGHATTGAASNGGSGPGSGGGTSGSNSGGGSTSGTITPGGPCSPGMQWIGNSCVQASCVGAPFGAPCQAGGQSGNCYDGGCLPPSQFVQDSSNCGTYGVSCPQGTQCVDAGCDRLCTAPDGGAPCAAGKVCSQMWGYGCVAAACPASSAGDPCMVEGGPAGACCAGACVNISGFDPANCGGCGVVCPSGYACYLGTCTPYFPACTGDTSLGPCLLDGGPGGGPLGDDLGFCCAGTCQSESDPSLCEATGLQCGAGLAEGLQCEFENTKCCGGTCVAMETDPANCGSCGNVCGPSESCLNGLCFPALPNCQNSLDGTLCDGGVCCNGACNDLRSDPNNCYYCRWACADGGSCQDSFCSTECTDGSQCPSGVCTILGSCLSPCNALSTGSECPLNGKSGPSTVCCGSVCADLESDPSNCGGCGASCGPGGTCVDGQCASCAMSGSGCPNGFTCEPNGVCAPQTCSADGAACALAAGGVGSCCGSTCVSLLSDPENCRLCGLACPQGSLCQQGECLPFTPCALECPTDTLCNPEALIDVFYPQPACVSGECPTNCEGLACPFDGICAAQDGNLGYCCSGACLDLSGDPNNCGACGTVCAAGQTCQRGVCG